MKHYFLYISGALLLIFTACSRDKGNYDYVELPDPVINNLDTMYTAVTGDSLIISPEITLPSGKNDYSCHWKINVPAEARSLDYEGKELRIVFGLGASRYTAQLAVMDNTTGMKYFYDFVIVAQTVFTNGVVVLSNSGSQAVLTFIKPDGTLQPDIYQAINKENLPGPALQLVPVQNMFYLNTLTSYWLIYSGDHNGGVQVNANTLERIKYLRDNFYEPPASVQPGYFMNMLNGITNAVMNGKLFIGATETAPFWPYYGFYGVPIAGNYTLHPLVLNNFAEAALSGKSFHYYIGFDANRKQFLRFYANTYYGTDYTVLDAAFNPKDLKMDLLYMNRFSDNDQYAFCDSAGKKLELKFKVNFTDSTQQFYATSKREFPGAGLLTAGSLWQSSPIGVFFFSAQDKIYRYNPLNNDIKPLEADLGGKKVTMLKVLHEGNLLVAGVEGSIYYLDISTGKLGQVIKKTDGIPGTPQDLVVRD